jgi:hypothetical protein
MAPLLAPLLTTLAQAGLGILGNAILAKGKDVVEEKLGVKIPDNPADLNEGKLTELAQAQMKHQEYLINAALEETKAFLQDRQNARAMQVVTVQQGDLFAKRFIYYLAMFWSGFAALYIVSITFVDFPVANRRFADTILGFVLGTVIAAILNFFYGTSQGSVKAQQFMRDIIDKKK